MKIYYAVNIENQERFFTNEEDAISFDAYQEPLAVEAHDYLEALKIVARILFPRRSE